ncbi:cbb3-type cytochrome oxidase assembly protein CcoS [Marinimicrobium alkaliphilum]|uniref:cbb3-type cytochrome oxidase assembly protein CcoS n=1 Tax=Marinimicrobium alkaliphilum TaxID=2202654 RepID=UPI000DB9E3FC|nr:cbb3-type cytochrome oxidase assembly protein CcoS [Marinimicrobium alkaliphilum]
MESLFILIPIGIVFIVIAVKILFWAINSGQYDNLDTEAHRILFDEETHLNPDRADRESEPSEEDEPGAEPAPERNQDGERKSP